VFCVQRCLVKRKKGKREWVSKHARHFCIRIPGIYIYKEEMKKQGYTSNCMPKHRTKKKMADTVGAVFLPD
jgi:RNase P/RNase MRP subunit p29